MMNCMRLRILEEGQKLSGFGVVQSQFLEGPDRGPTFCTLHLKRADRLRIHYIMCYKVGPRGLQKVR